MAFTSLWKCLVRRIGVDTWAFCHSALLRQTVLICAWSAVKSPRHDEVFWFYCVASSAHCLSAFFWQALVTYVFFRLHIATQRCAVQCGLLLCDEVPDILKSFFKPWICVIVFDFKLSNCYIHFCCLHDPTADLLFRMSLEGEMLVFFQNFCFRKSHRHVAFVNLIRRSRSAGSIRLDGLMSLSSSSQTPFSQLLPGIFSYHVVLIRRCLCYDGIRLDSTRMPSLLLRSFYCANSLILWSSLAEVSAKTAYGLMANFCLLFFYAAPMSTLTVRQISAIHSGQIHTFSRYLDICSIPFTAAQRMHTPSRSVRSRRDTVVHLSLLPSKFSPTWNIEILSRSHSLIPCPASVPTLLARHASRMTHWKNQRPVPQLPLPLRLLCQPTWNYRPLALCKDKIIGLAHDLITLSSFCVVSLCAADLMHNPLKKSMRSCTAAILLCSCSCFSLLLLYRWSCFITPVRCRLTI